MESRPVASTVHARRRTVAPLLIALAVTVLHWPAADAEFAFDELFEDEPEDLIITTGEGEEFNLDDNAGIDAPPTGGGEAGLLDGLPEGDLGGPTPEDDAAAASAETGI